MEKNFRITFHNGPTGNLSRNIDVCADSLAEARRLAFQMPEAKDRRFTEMSIGEIPQGPSVIGIEYECRDTVYGTKETQYLFIKANNESEAARYYVEHYKNTRFDYPDPRKTADSGRFVRGKILQTYFAGTITGMPNYDADATLKGSETLDSQIQNAAQRAGRAQQADLPRPAQKTTPESPQR